MIVLVTEVVTALTNTPTTPFSYRVKSYLVDLEELNAYDPYRRVLTSSKCPGYINANNIRWRECAMSQALLQVREAGKGNFPFPSEAILEPPQTLAPEKFIYVYGSETEPGIHGRNHL